jgi:Cof subfamily protein (haloacid dehalogenase superfamily)
MRSLAWCPPRRISAVVCDVDGTLVTDNKILTVRSQHAVAELHARGIIFTIISSRPPRGLRMLLAPLEISTPIGCFNGGVIARLDLSVIAQHLLVPNVARRTIDMLDAHGVQPWVFTGQDWLVRDCDGSCIECEERTVKFRPTLVTDFQQSLEFAAKIVGVSKDFELLVQCERDIGAALAGHASVARSQPYYLDITHPLANKGTALAELAKLLGVPLAEIATIGDGGNDIAMFERSALSIAMGNASARVQQAADFVTGSNRDDGFADAIRRFILARDHSDAPIGSARAGDRAW